jgi:Zn-dependent protease
MDVNLGHLLVWYLVFLFSTTLHEAAHALFALKGGDPTAYYSGHVTLDPTPHIRRSPFGMVVVPLVSFVLNNWMIGWASVPYDPSWARRNPRKASVMSLAGPAANFSIALVALAVIWVLFVRGVVWIPPTEYQSFTQMAIPARGTGDPRSLMAALCMGLSIAVNLNVLLGLFNLFPLPPLDGAGVLEGALPGVMQPLYDKLREVPMFDFLGLVLAWRLFGYVAWPVCELVPRLLVSLARV